MIGSPRGEGFAVQAPAASTPVYDRSRMEVAWLEAGMDFARMVPPIPGKSGVAVQRYWGNASGSQIVNTAGHQELTALDEFGKDR
jgi:hypothetical protein